MALVSIIISQLHLLRKILDIYVNRRNDLILYRWLIKGCRFRQGHPQLNNDEVVQVDMFESRLDIQSSSSNLHTQHHSLQQSCHHQH